MEQYNITGMSCAACSARVEKAVSKVPGVSSCSVSLLTNSMGVEGTAAAQDIIKAVVDAGYGASQKGSKAQAQEESLLADTETPSLAKRLAVSVMFLLILMYFSMGHMMLGFPIPAMLENHAAMALFQMLIASVILIINNKFFVSGYRSLLMRAPNMDTLVALGSTAAFGYSLAELFLMIDAMGAGRSADVMSYAHNLYFEASAMIPTLITVGRLLESISKGRTTDALKSLMKLAPKTASVERNGEEVTVPADQVKAGDIFVVRPGESIPADGVILEGNSAVNESALTGESIPVDKQAGDQVSAATINQEGFIRCRAVRVGEDTALSQIIKMMSDAAATKAPIARIADQVSGVFVPLVMCIAAAVFAGWLIAGQTFDFAIARGISVLVISCPCALGLATPVAIMVGNGVGAKNGILFKTAVSLEMAGKTLIAALDKTGTITKGMPEVTDVLPAEGISEGELLSYASALERKSEHPLARAVVAYAAERGSGAGSPDMEDFQALPGNGLSARLKDESRAEICGGSYRFIASRSAVSDKLRQKSEELAEQGKTPLFFCRGGELIGCIAVADVIKEDSAEAISELRNMGMRVVMLTGDNKRTAGAIGAQAGVDAVISDLLPQDKEAAVRKLKSGGRTLMTGDGINDAPALAGADLGIAIGAGTDVAIDAADVVLMKSSLKDLSAAVRLSRRTVRNIHENLFWAFFYNVICIPLAAGIYQCVFGLDWEMSPVLGAAAMSLSSFCVCMNALRLNLADIRDPRRDRALRRQADLRGIIGGGIDERNGERMDGAVMEKTINIEGMMCKHCEANVKNALEALEGVESAEVSHEKGTAVVKSSAPVEDAVLKEAVEAKDYKVISIA